MMSLERYDAVFEDYLQKISLTNTQADIIYSALEHATELFYTAYDGDVEIYPQGSFALGTIVKPLTRNESIKNEPGDYDVDIVIERQRWREAEEALNDVRNVLVDEFSEKVDKKRRRSCERVYYGTDYNTDVSFHVDFVPILNSGSTHVPLRKAADRSNDSWFKSDTKALVDWFEKERSKKPFLVPLIVIAKRMRDLAGLTDSISSICIMGIACKNYVDEGTYAGDILKFLEKAKNLFAPNNEYVDVRIETQEDNLAKNITKDQKQKLYDYYSKAYDELKVVFNSREFRGEIFEKYFGKGFLSDADSYPDCLEALRRKNITILTNGDLKRMELIEKGIVKRKNFGVSPKFKKETELIFACEEKVEGRCCNVWWQVLNAKGSEKRRGELFKAKRINYDGGETILSKDQFTNYEVTKYNGEHWIRCFVVNDKNEVFRIAKKHFVVVDD